MTTPDGITPYLTFRGQMVQATYHESRIERYQGNPTIEALPEILSKEQVSEALAYDPPYKREQRFWPDHLREHLIQGIVDLFITLPIHIDLYQRFSRVLCDGYVDRNPLAVGHYKDIEQRVAALAGEQPKTPRRWSHATGFNIYGVPGGGKTLSLQHVLSLFPQVIFHHRYRGQDCSLVQLVWLMLQCPFDGSTRGLCLNFFQAVDSVLGTHYFANYVRRRAIQDELLQDMARVASLHSLGVLVIDEVQFLNTAKSGGIQKMLNFFVQLVNTISIPILLVGTYKAYPLFTGEFRQARRGTGQGDMPWDSLPPDETWNEFLDALWDYQYVHRESPLTKDIREVLYELTLGIPDLAIKVFMLAQYRAIARGKEEIDVDVIRSVAVDSFRSINGMLAAVRRGDLEALQQIGDILLLEDKAILAEWRRRLQKGQRAGEPESPKEGTPADGEEAVSTTGQRDQEELPTQPTETPGREQVAQAERGELDITSLEESGEQKGHLEKVSRPSKKTRSEPTPSQKEAEAASKGPVEQTGLWAALLRARAQKISGYQATAEAGYAKHYRALYPDLQQAKRIP